MIYTLGECLLELIFKEGKQIKAIAGGSAINTAVSLGRLNLPVHILTEFGLDEDGAKLEIFFQKNNVSLENVYRHKDGKTTISNAILNDRNEARYKFFSDPPAERFNIPLPEFTGDDIFLMGSWFAINPLLREKVKKIISQARSAGALIVYDPNFREVHLDEISTLIPIIEENILLADIVRGSDEDFNYIFNTEDPIQVFSKIKTVNPCLIYTMGKQGVLLQTKYYQKHFITPEITPVSTIGAGDNFNAGLIYSLNKKKIIRDDLIALVNTDWDFLVQTGIQFASNVCMSDENYISESFAQNLKNEQLGKF
ncbi:MAG: PfkB family carbohydrate kinase [Bacteroidales bacterium]|nr:PfkB family carbohydrate kinase [Bacteroidales bacterium]